jgi:hypothetical protein
VNTTLNLWLFTALGNLIIGVGGLVDAEVATHAIGPWQVYLALSVVLVVLLPHVVQTDYRASVIQWFDHRSTTVDEWERENL